MYYLIHGEDTYRSRKKLEELVQNLAVSGEVLRFDASHDGVAGLVEERCRGGNLFGAEPLLVVQYPLSGTPENRERFLDASANFKQTSAVIIFWEMSIETAHQSKKSQAKRARTPKTDSRLQAFFNNADAVFEFSCLANSAFETYVNEMASAKKIALSESEIRALARESGGDLWMAAHELEKYALTGSFDHHARAMVSEKLFDFMDALMVGNQARAFELWESARQSGFEEHFILAALAGTIRNMLKVKSILPFNPDYRRLAEFGMHEFVLKKTLSQIRRFRLEDLKRLYTLVADTDIALKTTGSLDSNALAARLIAAFE